MASEIVINSPEEKKLREKLEARTDTEALRMKRFLAMPDLSRTPGSPLHEIVERILAIPEYQTLDIIKVPEIVPVGACFDLFNFPPDHPARSKSDTYFVNDDQILRPHTTVMWHYHLNLPEVKARVARGEAVGAWSYGKVYRKDEIDRRHMNVFHQIDGYYLARKDDKKIGLKELQDVLVAVGKAVYGPDLKHRFNPDTFPYTDPSLEMEAEVGGKWVELVGSGVVHDKVLDNLGVDSKEWNGWAFGSGLERLAILSMDLPDIRLLWSNDERVKRQLKLGQKYKEVSKFPPITRDISFVVPSGFVPNDYFDLIRDIGGDLVEEVSLLDKYENQEKFGAGKISYTYRIIYRSPERTLTVGEIEPIQEKITEETKKQFNAEVR
jgi:phenylalanyl-tRNA synthetase alpha chain